MVIFSLDICYVNKSITMSAKGTLSAHHFGMLTMVIDFHDALPKLNILKFKCRTVFKIKLSSGDRFSFDSVPAQSYWLWISNTSCWKYEHSDQYTQLWAVSNGSIPPNSSSTIAHKHRNTINIRILALYFGCQASSYSITWMLGHNFWKKL